MKLNKELSRLGAAFLGVACLCAPASARLSAQLQLSVAVPDPIVASEELTVQAIIFNNGTQTWAAGEYSAEVEIFNASKNYVAKTPRKKGTQIIKPSEAALFYVPFAVPAGFSGSYFYKVYLIHKDQRISESDFFGFNVVALTPAAKTPSALEIGGNSFIYYKGTSKYDWADYSGNFNLNLIGAVNRKPMMFNLYTFHTPKSTSAPSDVNHEIYTIFFSYYADDWSVALGDVLPVFSPLSLYGAGMRGGVFDVKSGGFSAQMVGARSVVPREGASTTDGVYERMLGGFRAEYDIAGALRVGGSYLYGFDRRESIRVAGPTLRPSANAVMGGTIKARPSETVGITVEYQTSDYRADVDVTSSPSTGDAYRLEAKWSPANFNVRGAYQMTGPKFNTFGAPGATKDRKTIDLSSGLTLFSKLNLSAGYLNYTDNVQNDPAKVTTNQNMYSGGVSLSLDGALPSPSVSYSYNEAYAANPNRDALDNVTETASFGLAGRVVGANYSAAFQRSDFADRNKTADDLRSDTLSSGFSFSPVKVASVNLGATLSVTDNLVKNTKSKTESASAAVNMKLIPEKLTSQLWGSLTERKNPAEDTDVLDSGANLEFTYQFTGSLAWTFGGGLTRTEDKVAKAGSTEHGVSTRLSYSF
ncbi:MAG: hypothetical protein QME32_02330 [Endomicrobiia bacterium]|nr:hypothetical protein [Endomicrobiia bacterium]